MAPLPAVQGTGQNAPSSEPPQEIVKCGILMPQREQQRGVNMVEQPCADAMVLCPMGAVVRSPPLERALQAVDATDRDKCQSGQADVHFEDLRVNSPVPCTSEVPRHDIVKFISGNAEGPLHTRPPDVVVEVKDTPLIVTT